jgi:hypothetical protein
MRKIAGFRSIGPRLEVLKSGDEFFPHPPCIFFIPLDTTRIHQFFDGFNINLLAVLAAVSYRPPNPPQSEEKRPLN